MNYPLLYSKNKRPKNSLNELKKEILDYLNEETKKGHFPSRRWIEKNFHLRFITISKNINSLYNEAGLIYKLTQNQEIKTVKAQLLLELIIKNIKKFGLKLILSRGIHERGVDIICKNRDKRIGVELKAYNKNEKLKQRDIAQVEKFIEKEKLNKAIIVTTTNLKDKEIRKSGGIKIIYYNELINILKDMNVKEEFSFIRKNSVNIQDTSKKIKRQKILDFVSRKYCEDNKKAGCLEITRELHLDIYTYFRNLFEIYKILRIPPPLKNKPKQDIDSTNLWKEEFKRYILEEIKRGKKYPSGEDIGKHFGISHIWNITKVSELYKELGLKPYLERKKRTTSFQES